MATNLEKMQQRGEEAKAQSQGYSEIPYFKEKEGMNQIRILPGYGGRDVPYIEYKKVFVRDRNTGFTPRAQHGFADCPFEAHFNELKKRTDEASKKECDRFQLRNRVAFIVIDRNNEQEGPKVWETNLQNLATVCAITTDPECGDIFDPERGVDLKIDFVKKGKSAGFPDWSIRTAMGRTPLSVVQERAQEWLSKDWFEEYGAGRASEAGWISAVIAGTEESYKEGRKGSQTETATREQLPKTNAAPSTNGKMETPPWEGPSDFQYPFSENTKFWILGADNSPQDADCAAIQKLVNAGQDPMTANQSSPNEGWKLASVWGFKKAAAAAPPAPPAPPSAPPAPPAPPMNSVSAELRAQLAGLTA